MTAKILRVVLLSSILCLAFGGLALAHDGHGDHEHPHATAEQGKHYGKDLSDSEIVPISKLMAAPDDFVGKSVKVEGRVVGVCAKRGCWMDLAGDEEFESLRIKVEDGVIVFPMEAKGKMAVAEGTLEKIELTKEQTHAMKQHECQKGEGEKGEEHSADSCVKEPGVYYQIRGEGAVVY